VILPRLVLVIALGGAARADLPFQVTIDISKAPEVSTYAYVSKALCEEWYPKINEILFGKDHPLPFQEIQIVFEPREGVPAFTRGNVIHVASNVVRRMHDEYRGIVVHEVTHVNQNLGLNSQRQRWVVEGIADYIPHKYFEKDIEPKLRLDEAGRLKGYSPDALYLFSIEKAKIKLNRKGYRASYEVAAAFLFWIEEKKRKDIVQTLNAALTEGRYSAKIFQQACGMPLDELWREFVVYSRQQSP
jgi:hypothetical protein